MVKIKKKSGKQSNMLSCWHDRETLQALTKLALAWSIGIDDVNVRIEFSTRGFNRQHRLQTCSHFFIFSTTVDTWYLKNYQGFWKALKCFINTHTKSYIDMMAESIQLCSWLLAEINLLKNMTWQFGPSRSK